MHIGLSQLVSCSLCAACWFSVWSFRILNTSSLAVCLLGFPLRFAPLLLENGVTSTEIFWNRSPAQSFQNQWNYWKETKLSSLFSSVQLWCNFAPWGLFLSPGSCSSMNNSERSGARAALLLLCASKETRQRAALRLLEGMLGRWFGLGSCSRIQAVRQIEQAFGTVAVRSTRTWFFCFSGVWGYFFPSVRLQFWIWGVIRSKPAWHWFTSDFSVQIGIADSLLCSLCGGGYGNDCSSGLGSCMGKHASV